MKFSIAFLSLLAAVAMAAPSVAPDSNALLDSRDVDCKKCRCSSKESCTFQVSFGSFDSSQPCKLDSCIQAPMLTYPSSLSAASKYAMARRR
ncbi:hypothetical protein MAPG_04158 [Magnaporthiopsis poae ATCC 64411]|uniref:Apple domain-containing protein n=1 Tax=Magnaporthiopsis poae (strain ATCC 64411 / 73-15) TaxID=644358 RepID=A0A0C4DVZ0_MAGP6|nr:hypothetical protein MAPG_04158 [Magnaporthiopsis poae ATCC 64411]